MESSEALLPQSGIELALNNILDDTSKVLKEHCRVETVRASIEVKIELTEEQTSLLPSRVQENLKAPEVLIVSCKVDSNGHVYGCKLVGE